MANCNCTGACRRPPYICGGYAEVCASITCVGTEPDWRALQQFVRPDVLAGIWHDFEMQSAAYQRRALGDEIAQREAMFDAAGW